MKITESYLKKDIQQRFHLKIGDFYFFEHFAVVEYAEDVVVSLKSLSVMIVKSIQFYGLEKPYGLIVNKIHNYVTIPTDAMKLEEKLPNLAFTAVVSYNLPSVINFDLENHFFKAINRQVFTTLEAAEQWILKMVKQDF